jgi:hypothetical protein
LERNIATSILLKAGRNQIGDSKGDCGDHKDKKSVIIIDDNRGIYFKKVPPIGSVYYCSSKDDPFIIVADFPLN